jgi:Tfp pilus assembly protein PilF
MTPRALALLACALVVTAQTTTSPTREAAYRANNIGVAYLEQYDFDTAITAFRRALEQDSALAIARLNLGIALFYAGQHEPARQELERARTVLPDRPHADFVLGLIDRAGDRTDAALQDFSRAQKLDATDPGININIGQLQLQQRHYPEALTAFRAASAAEPYNATAQYGLATALIRSGAADEGKVAMDKFERLRSSGYATTFSQAYLEQGRYAEAIASTGAEASLVDPQMPEVGFVNATREWLPNVTSSGASVTLLDLDHDGDLDIAIGGPVLHLYRNDGGRFTDIATAAFATVPNAIKGVVAGDCDNDGDTDLLLFGSAGPPTLYRQESPNRFVAAGNDVGVPDLHSVTSAAWLDADHDGDLDLAIAGRDAQKSPTVVLLRNNGEGRFTDVSAPASLQVARSLVSIVPTDFDDRRDIDMFMLPASGAPLLFRNLRDGTFADVAAERGLRADAEFTCVAAGDFNKDGYPDFFLGQRAAPGTIAASDGRAGFAVSAAPPVTAGALACQLLDYDNDGLLDLVALTTSGLKMLRNVGGGWSDVSERVFQTASAQPLPPNSLAQLASGDLDGDGDTDLIVGESNSLTIWRNDGGSRAASLRVRLTPRVSNRTAIGTKVEVRAGSLRQKLERYSAVPAPAPADLVFGFGARPGADVARVLWPSGILQAETAAGGATAKPLAGELNVQELDRKPSSCPYLYTWNGERFDFITDFLGGGEMGYWEGPRVYNQPDPDEYVRIAGDRLKPRNGRYELRITNELEEVLFLDRAQLVAVEHPADVEIHPNEGLRAKSEPFRLIGVRHVQSPTAVEDEHGHDVLDRVRRMDRKYPDDFTLGRIRGYAKEHSLTITLPPAMDGRRALLLTGWTDYAFSGDNVAAHQLGLPTLVPSLQIADGHGQWRTAIDDIGFPVGRPQTVVVDLTGKVPASVSKVRIVTTMRVYWDEIRVGTIVDASRATMTRLDPLTSTLTWRGFSAPDSPDGREPFGADYTRVTTASPWKQMPGRYTREGDVRQLLLATDDQFIVSRPGDEIAVSFDATRVPEVPDGWTTTFLLYADGFSKEMDLNSASPDEVEPLPFHGMTRYPYPASEAPRRGATYQAYLDRYNTRVVKKLLPPIELSAEDHVAHSLFGGRLPN